GLEPIFDGMGVQFKVSKIGHKSFDDIIVSSHDSAATQYRETYVFDGHRYKSAKTEYVNLETREVKPAEVAIHFPMGSSSMTLRGKVSIGFGDTYTVVAKDGQSMKIEFPYKSGLTLMVEDPKGSSVTKEWQPAWEGTLSATGKYRILVNCDSENPVPYTMSISIK